MNNKWKSFGIEDQVAIVSGASEGIGRTLAVALAEAGAHVALASRTQTTLDEVASEIEALGRQALVVPTDLTDVAQIPALVAKTMPSTKPCNMFARTRFCDSFACRPIPWDPQ